MTGIERAARALEETVEWEGGAVSNPLETVRAVIAAIRDHFEDVAEAQQGASEAAESEQATIAVSRTHALIDALEALLEEGNTASATFTIKGGDLDDLKPIPA